jgi:hypothetical protein
MPADVTPTLAAYGSASLTEVVPALTAAPPRTQRDWLPAAARDATSIVLLVVDGLGAHALDEHPECLPTLLAMDRAVITSVLPATTAAALTSLTTAAPPSRHGLVGYRTFVDDHVINTLRWQMEGERAGRAPDPLSVQRMSAFRDNPVPVVTKTEFRRTGFTAAHLGFGPFHGWKTVSMLVEHCRVLVDAGERFVYAYYPGVDEVAHEHGLSDGFYAAELRAADELVAHLLGSLPESCALVVTADHGQVDMRDDAWIDTLELAPLLRAQSGDARFRHLHARPGAAGELAQECERRFADVAWVRSRKAIIEEEWLGPRPVPAVGGRIGDVVLAPFTNAGFLDPALPRERGLKSAHGAPTPAEMFVPLLAARGSR